MEVIKGKDIVVYSYDCSSSSLVANGTETKFGIPIAAIAGINGYLAYCRAYVDNKLVAISSANVGAKAAFTTATMVAGSKAITGTLLTTLVPGSIIYQTDVTAVIKSVESENAATLVSPWAGSSAVSTHTGGGYVVITVPDAGSRVTVVMPISKNPVMSVQQDVTADIKVATDEIRVLGDSSVSRSVLNKSGSLTMSFIQAENHSTLSKLAAASKNNTLMLIVVKYKTGNPVFYKLYHEARVGNFGSGVTAGGSANENATFNWVAPVVLTEIGV
mgnify:FL=1